MGRHKGTKNGEAKPYKRGDTYYGAISVAGKTKRVSLKTQNYREAVKEMARIRGEMEEAARNAEKKGAKSLMVKDGWDVYEPSSKALRERLAREYRKNWNAFVEYCVEKGLEKLEDVGTLDGTGFLTKMAEDGYSASSLNKCKVQIARIITEISEGTIPNPFSRVKNLDRIAKPTVLYDNLSDTEVEILTEVAKIYELERRESGEGNEEWHLLFRIAAETGMRLKDCALLKWSSVKTDEGKIDTITYKTGSHVVIHIFGDLLKDLKDLKGRLDWEDIVENRENEPVYVMPNIAKRYMSGDNNGNICKYIKEIFDKAIPGDKIRKDADGKEYKKSFHSFRVHVASKLGAAGCPLMVATSIMGHSALMYAHYFRGDDTVSREYMEKAMKKRWEE